MNALTKTNKQKVLSSQICFLKYTSLIYANNIPISDRVMNIFINTNNNIPFETSVQSNVHNFLDHSVN